VAINAEPPDYPDYASFGFDTSIELQQLQPLVHNPRDPQVRALAASRIVAANYDDANDLRGLHKFYFSLTGQHFATVSIRDITFRIVSRRPSPRQAIVWLMPQGGADAGEIGFDLDSDDTRARVVDKLGLPTKEHYFDHKQVTLTKEEPFRFVGSAIARNADYDFVLDVNLIDGTTAVVDNKGKPWTVAAYSPSYSQAFALHIGAGGLELIPCRWPVDCRRY
jgi:hypothetical protein